MKRLVNGVEVDIPADELAALAAEQLAGAKSARIAWLNSDCAQAIVSGFQSSALGEPHTYPSHPTDQQNLSAAVTASQLPVFSANKDWRVPFPCADAQHVWARREHTAAQIQQVGMDAFAAVAARLQQKDALVLKVQAAKTEKEVAAIVWPA